MILATHQPRETAVLEAIRELGLEYHITRWFREMLKDDALAEAAERVEKERDATAQESKARIRAAIEERYTAPE